MSKPKFPFRDVSYGLRKFRDFLLGRKHTLHGRFPPALAPRSIPPAAIPRGMQLKYSEKYYFERNALNSVKPPIVWSAVEGASLVKGGTDKVACYQTKVKNIFFEHVPTPGPTWWWDGHSFYNHTTYQDATKPSTGSEGEHNSL